MRLVLLLLTALTLATPKAWASCVKEVDFSDEAKLQAEIDNAYFIGFVQGVYYQEYPNGTFKEAGVKPFMVYRADPNLDLSQTIVIKEDENNDPDLYDSQDRCEYNIPGKGIYAELVLINENGETKLLYNLLLRHGDYLKKHRKNIRYVSPEGQAP